MKFFTPAFFLLAWANLSFAQSFQATPSPLLTQEVGLDLANECFIYFDNPSGDTLQLQWRSLESSLPAGWIVDLCDFGTCYIGIPQNGVMIPAWGAAQPYLKLIVQPGATEGAAWLWFRVNELGNQDNYADVYFDLHTSGVSGVGAPASLTVRVYPNPAQDYLFIENEGNEPLPARLSDVSGKVIWQENLLPGSHTRVDIQPFPAGFYFLQTKEKTHKVLIE